MATKDVTVWGIHAGRTDDADLTFQGGAPTWGCPYGRKRRGGPVWPPFFAPQPLEETED